MPHHRPFRTVWRSLLESITLSLCLQAALCASSLALSPNDALAPYEQQFFSQSFIHEPESHRLERLENSVFGEIQPGTATERQARLLKALQKTRLDTPEPAAAASSSGHPQASSNTASPSTTAPPAMPDATDYPTVTALEQEVFKRNFKQDEIGHRLDRLEQSVFGRSDSQQPLVDRVDKLLSRYPSITPAKAHAADSQVASPTDRTYSANYRSEPPTRTRNSFGRPAPSSPFGVTPDSQDVYAKVSALEQRVLKSPPPANELLSERLDRLEATVYGRTYSGESVDVRTNRLLSGFSTNQNRYAANNRPGFQPRPSLQTTPSANGIGSVATGYNAIPTARPQNIQMGSGFQENSTHQFSPEMMAMLPPDVRSQFSSGGTRSTTTVQQNTSSYYPGFQPYGNPNMPYYNYSGMPNVVQNTTTTTQIQPGYALPGTTTVPYVGDPQVLQNLGVLEANVFGQVNATESVSTRIGKLESALLRQTYPQLPELQRLATLQNAYQLQAAKRLLGQTPGFASQSGFALQQQGGGNTSLGIPLGGMPNPVSVPPVPRF